MSVFYYAKYHFGGIEMTRRYYNEKRADNKRKNLLIVILLIIVVMIIAFFIFRVCSNKQLTNKPQATPVFLDDEGGSLEGEVKAKEREEILKQLKKEQLVVTDKLSSNITFPSGEIGAVGEWIVENPEENNIIQQAEVYLNNQLIAKSTPIYPNQHISGVSLLEEVEPGEYEVIAYLNYYDIETKKFISKAGYKIHLTVR